MGMAKSSGRPANDRFLRACVGLPVDRPPVWIMRQAGRYLPEYQAVRSRRSFWEMCTIPEVTTEVTLQPVRRLGVDAAILFSDILVPLVAMGMEVRFHPAPEITAPLRNAADVARLHVADPGGVYASVAEAVRLIRRALDGEVPLIGFAGAPFTVATYAVCGGGSRNQAEIRALLFSDPATAHRLLHAVADAVIASLEIQCESGAQAVQLFDSWAGILSREEYIEFARPYAIQVLERIERAGLPRIYFAPGAMTHLEAIAGSIPAEALGIDWRMPLREAAKIVDGRAALQGNLDPAVLLGTSATIRAKTRGVIDEGRSGRGHIMNLGHGILPETPVENAQIFVDAAKGEALAGGED
jgi:uroporphyrinogen decarboxylase